MSTDLKPVKNHSMVRFWGGERGKCVQVTAKAFSFDHQKEGFITLDHDGALELAEALVQFARGTREEIF